MISFIENNQKFNYRVGAIIISSDKKRVLLHTIKNYGFYLLPGGRVEWMEFCTDAIKRELYEEIGLQNIQPRERALIENFFSFNDVNFQELSNNFVVELNTSHSYLEENEEFTGIEGDKYIYKWVNLDKIDEYVLKPTILKNIIKNYRDKFEYIKVDERVQK